MPMTETFHGYIETTQDVLLVFEGCRRGLLPRVCRRLHEKERKMIRSGSVFVFDERESGIKRWTDGMVWSPSRILGNFLIYRELDKRSVDRKMSLSRVSPALDARQRSFSVDQSATSVSMDRTRERRLVGSLSDSYRFRKDGLIKKTMSVVVNGIAQHLISYYHPQDIVHNALRTPSSVAELAGLEISPELLVKQNFRIPPMVEPTFDPHERLQQAVAGMSPEERRASQPQPPTPTQPQPHPAHHHAQPHSPSRSMSVGSLRAGEAFQPTIHGQMIYNTPYVPQGDHAKYSPTMSNFGHPQVSIYSPYPPIPSPSSPGTPMLSPVRPSFQHQRHYSTSSASSASLSSSMSRLDNARTSYDFSQHHAQPPVAPDMGYYGESRSLGHEHGHRPYPDHVFPPQRDQPPPPPPHQHQHQHHSSPHLQHPSPQEQHPSHPLHQPHAQQPHRFQANANIGQLLNPVHPLQQHPSAEGQPNQALLHSMAIPNNYTPQPAFAKPNGLSEDTENDYRSEDEGRDIGKHGADTSTGTHHYMYNPPRQQPLVGPHYMLPNGPPLYRSGVMSSPASSSAIGNEIYNSDLGYDPLMLK